ncbi:hypothetical protein ACILG0_01110 [Pseudomonadota bacterium AL_CKDN230030165-1A_HGKHYDSX7]
MTLTNASESKDLAEVANDLERLLIAKAKDLTNRIALVERDIERIRTLTRLSEGEERSKALAKTLASLTQAKRLLAEVRKTGGFGGLLTPIKTLRHWRAVKRARSAHDIAEATFDATETKAERDARIADHNHKVDSEHSRLPGLNGQENLLKTEQSAIEQLHRTAVDAIRAACDSGWLAKDFPERFRRLAALVENNDINRATASLSALVFQRRPTESRYERWNDEANALRSKAYRQYAGMAASGAYTEIAQHSIQLAVPALRAQATATLADYNHPADQWQVLSALLSDPRRFRTDALWAIYWAMHQCGQWVADAASESDAHEDVFTGKVTAQIDRWLAGWATERIREFGYPEVRSYLGALEIASTTEETRLGADIGLIVDLNIGDLTCQKIVLLQAKKTKHGVTNVGSHARQLSKLSSRPSDGFYLFYHQSTHPVIAPAPSVCAAHELADKVAQLGKDIDAAHLPLNVRSMGWDWASFISFGLCNPNSKIGQSFDTVEEALTALGNGDARNLPRYLHVIAIADEPRVMALRAKVQEHYIDSVKAMAKVREKDRHLSHGRGGPKHGMSM